MACPDSARLDAVAEEIDGLRREGEGLREELAALQRAHARLASQLYSQRTALETALRHLDQVEGAPTPLKPRRDLSPEIGLPDTKAA